VPLLNTGIAWPSDKEMKFRNPEGNLTEGTYLIGFKRFNAQYSFLSAFKDYDKPPSWRKNLYELDPTNSSNNGLENEDLMVWMRTSALPTFRKLYRRVDHSNEGFISGLLRGNYLLTVKYCNYSFSSHLKF
jgi:LEM3 (ligand-effect modulator 3) family / CDC50 family